MSPSQKHLNILTDTSRSVERILFYGNLVPEGAATTPNDPPPSWPTHGAIKFKDVELRYRPGLPLILQGLSLDIKPVGVVGRNGAGKSSLIAALFRIANDLARGSIEIDGVDIASIGLQTLRQQLAIIPPDGNPHACGT